MDFFGIGAAIDGVTRVYFQSARRTGRTTSLVESAKDGDRIVFATAAESHRVAALLRERGVKADCITIDPKSARKVFERGTPQGRTIFDHTWVEQFYLNRLASAHEELALLQRESSGFGEAHYETRHAALARVKWE